jgi:hypothetical protein
MNILKPGVALSPLLVVLFFLLSSSSCVSRTSDELTWITSIDLKDPGVQRDRKKFTIVNVTEGQADWDFRIIDSETGDVVVNESSTSPSLSLRTGTYDVLVTAHGLNSLTRHYRRFITVLPKVFTEREADEVIDLSKTEGNSFLRDFNNKVRPGYKIIIKGTYNGRVKFTGLRGTKKKPVHIINQGKVFINAVNNTQPYAVQFSDNNQYIIFDGKADPSIPYGFEITGHPEKSGQIFFIAGEYNRGFELCGVHLKGQQGKTAGASALQLQTSYTPGCNASNWNFEYFLAHHNKIENASSEGMYIGYFTDEARDGGYVPFRLGNVRIFRDTVLNSGWDGIQIASADDFEIHDNYVNGASLSGKRSHSSFISWNSGNAEGWCYRNTFENCAHAASIIYGESGKEAYVYSNLFLEGTYPDNITTPNFFFVKITNEFKDPLLYIFNNTIVTSRIPVKVDYKNMKTDQAMPILFAGNAIILNRLNLKRYPEIAMGSNLTDSLSWKIDNVWRMKEKEAEMKWSYDFRPMEDSPLSSTGFDIRNVIRDVKGGLYDREGYSLSNSAGGYTYGCFSPLRLNNNTQTQ